VESKEGKLLGQLDDGRGDEGEHDLVVAGEGEA
jgi:hypothetical protein